jgi:MraZ protein
MNFDPQAAGAGDFPFTFHGSYTRAVDAKGRFHLPFRFRNQSPSAVVEEEEREKYMISPGLDGSVTLTPHAVWMENFNRLRAEEPSPEKTRDLRLMSLNSRMLSPDAQGRVAVPSEILEFLKVAKKVTVVGMGSHMELWSPEAVAEISPEGQGPSQDFMYRFYR